MSRLSKLKSMLILFQDLRLASYFDPVYLSTELGFFVLETDL